MRDIEYFVLPDGQESCREWILSLDRVSRARVNAYIIRVASGASKKNIKSLGDGLFEIRINVGPGYRVYFGQKKSRTILLIVGGDKSSQSKDIKRARMYWRSYA